MPLNFFPGFSGFSVCEEVTFERTRSILKAIDRSEDFEIEGAFSKAVHDQVLAEIIVVILACDGVPSANRVGINYKERLALCVTEDKNELVEVYPLRPDFPDLAHMNDTASGLPASFCLYFAPVKSVLRNWTPEKFLKRIYWWVESSSHEKIHASDQPVEQLFYTSPLQIVLPANYNSLDKEEKTSLSLMAGYRNATRETYIVTGDTSSSAGGVILEFISINCEPIIHGRVSASPKNFKDLLLIRADSGDCLVDVISSHLRDLVPEQGFNKEDLGNHLIILLNIPVLREEGGGIEKNSVHAFVCENSQLEVGLSLKAYLEHDSKIYRNLAVLDELKISPEALVSLPIIMAEVSFFSDADASRFQSGINTKGPTGSLVGVGSLGSAVVDIWNRAGWGAWNLIDNDYIKPHNLVRHVALSRQVGFPKVVAVGDILEAAKPDASVVKKCLEADASDFSLGVINALEESEIIIDASTSFDFPRGISSRDIQARCVSVFLTPNGNDTVLIGEDKDRKNRLIGLEGQYYRLILNSEWGERHLEGNLGSFWSGASCRDISATMPYSRILASASLLSERIPDFLGDPDSLITVWIREPENGCVSQVKCPTYPYAMHEFGNYSLLIDDGVKEKLHALRDKYLPNETGGIVLGYYDLIENKVVVVDILEEPSDSTSTPHSFERGVDGVEEYMCFAERRTAGVVGYLGEWHSHPPNCSASPSDDDLMQLASITLGMYEDGLPALLLIVNSDEVGIFQGVAC